MKLAYIALTTALLSGIGAQAAPADCNLADAQLEKAIMEKPEFRDPANCQMRPSAGWPHSIILARQLLVSRLPPRYTARRQGLLTIRL